MTSRRKNLLNSRPLTFALALSVVSSAIYAGEIWDGGGASGTVDAADYDLVKTHFGETAGIGSSSDATGSARLSSPKSASAHAAVPEPSPWILFAIASLALAQRWPLHPKIDWPHCL